MEEKIYPFSVDNGLRERLNSGNSDERTTQSSLQKGKTEKKYSMFSKIFFTWVFPLMSLSKKNSLNFKKLTQAESYNPNVQTDEVQRTYERLKRNYKNKNLFLIVIYSNIISLIFVSLVSLSLTLLKITQIRILGKVIVLFKKETITEDQYYKFFSYKVNPIFLFSSLLLLVRFLHILITHHNKNSCQLLGRRVSASLSYLINEKMFTSCVFSKNNINKGEMINYIQTDIETLNFLFFYGPMSLVVPCQILINTFMLFTIFGVVFIYSVLTLLILLTIAWMIQKLYISNQRDVLKCKDNRIKIITSVLQSIKMIKMYTLEQLFLNKINEKRNQELKSIKKLQNIYVLSGLVFWGIPLILSVVSIGTHTLIKGSIQIENLLMAIEIFDSLVHPLFRLPIFITTFLNTVVSMKRIEKFLVTPDISKCITARVNHDKADPNSDVQIKFENLDFGVCDKEKWKKLLHNVSLEIHKGEFVGVLGETGSGKTCLAGAILSHLSTFRDHSCQKDQKTEIRYVNGRISYASQTPFIVNDTIKNNIIFYNDVDEDKYQKVLSFCQLNQDLESFPAGDTTEISSNGTNISGGQKARINLARCVYNEADVYILDDPISSVDSIIRRSIFESVLLNFLKNKTRIYIKHDATNLKYFDKIIFLEKGNITFCGSYLDFIKTPLYQKVVQSKDNIGDVTDSEVEKKKVDNSVPRFYSDYSLGGLKDSTSEQNNTCVAIHTKDKGKLIKEEEQCKGGVKFSLFLSFAQIMGNGSYLYLIMVIIFSFIWQFFQIMSNFWLTKWNSDSKNGVIDDLKPENSNLYYFLIYCQIGGFSLFFLFLKEFILSRALLNVYRILHSKMIRQLIRAPVNLFHDTVPIGQVINRLNYDLDKCKVIIRQCSLILKAISVVIGSVLICYSFNHYSLIFVPLLFCLGYSVTSYYLSCGRDLSRIESISKAPILSCYNEIIDGIVTIRSFGKNQNFKEKFQKRVFNHYLLCSYKFGVDNWYNFILDFCSYFYLFFIVIFSSIYHKSITPGVIGLLLKYSLSLCEHFLNVFEEMSNIEKAMVNYERCNNYTKIPQERYIPKIMMIKEGGKQDESKEQKFKINSPKIVFENLSMRYRPNTDIILNNVSFTIEPYEKVGIVGRSGSGKSSLINAIFRIVEPLFGSIYIDNTDISKLSLQELRSEICLVPQDPFLFEGTLKQNLDPLGKHREDEIIDVMAAMNFSNLFHHGQNLRSLLNIKIEENGRNCSLGEKQLICFVRAILQKKKVVIFDEATGSVDKKTEDIICDCIKSSFQYCTILIIAHRLRNILDCDKILVMEKGNLVEFGNPKDLYNNENCIFRKLCENDYGLKL